MNDFQKNLIAIDKSIAKWRGIVFYGMSDRGPQNCALCKIYWWHRGCRGCPIQQLSRVICCMATPYDAWTFIKTHENVAITPEQIAAANHMLSFLYEVRLFWVNKWRKDLVTNQEEKENNNVHCLLGYQY